eukprot:TRINITY_DN6114_c0_g1_i1.p1 TRINITY_DN6114_c0_g1~~TRINITY_DN6114_c0_g1_i1.p1  ORF type:complete len:542 (-),score=72.65 TRINITY_DN6114_c0_g1_i1:72-1697(-)
MAKDPVQTALSTVDNLLAEIPDVTAQWHFLFQLNKHLQTRITLLGISTVNPGPKPDFRNDTTEDGDAKAPPLTRQLSRSMSLPWMGRLPPLPTSQPSSQPLSPPVGTSTSGGFSNTAGGSPQTLSPRSEIGEEPSHHCVHILERPPNVWKVALTGGPCAGKSTALSTITKRITTHGFRVYLVPEVATLFINGGITWTEMTPEKTVAFQSGLLDVQLHLENAFVRAAMAVGGPAVIVCDRGAMDGKAYADPESWRKILEFAHLDESTLRDRQYDAVFHLVTAAHGAEAFYTVANNAARTESVEQARELDSKVCNCYVGHPRLHIIDNSMTFSEKIQRVVEGIGKLCGIGGMGMGGNARKFLLAPPLPTIDQLPSSCQVFETRIILLYGSTADDEHRLYRRFSDSSGGTFYYQNVKVVDGARVLHERQLSAREFAMLKEQATDPLKPEVVKRNVSFLYNNQYFELAEVLSPTTFKGTAFLYANQTGTEPLVPPPFVAIDRDVTDDAEFCSFDIAASAQAEPNDPVTDPLPTAPVHVLTMPWVD